MAIEIIQDRGEFQYDRLELREHLCEVRDFAKSLIVNDEASFDTISSIYKKSKHWEKEIDSSRKSANEADQSRINGRNDMAKSLLAPLKEIQSIAHQKTAQYHALLEEKKKREEEKIREAADLIGIDDAPPLSVLERSIRGNGAIAYSRVVRKFRITDPSKIPVKYLQINEEAVNEAIKMGISEIPGLEIFDSKEIQLKAR